MSKKSQGANAVRAAIESAETVPPPSLVPDEVRRRVVMLENGLHRRTDGGLQWVAAPFQVAAETLDEAGNFGLLVTWRDREGQQREEVFGRELFAGEAGELRARLAAGGLTILPDQQSRQAFGVYLNVIEVSGRARVVSRCGWHHVGAGRVFVLPAQVIGGAGHRVLLASGARAQAPFAASGTLDEWRRGVAALVAGNSRLVFAVACAFAGALLELSGDDGGGFNLKGPSRAGKTTALRAAASVWGGGPGFGAGAFIRSWRATGNALEAVAAAHSDTLLCLDEMGQVEGKELGEISYMLANGQGKSRADRGGAARVQSRFRVLFLSTGEVGLADKSAEGRKAVKAGQEVRFVDVAAEAGAGLGIFEQLHDEPGPAALAELLKTGTRRFYGTAGPEFVRVIVGRLAAPDFQDRLAAKIDDVVTGWLARHPDATGQVRSVARRFALVAVAGELATEGGVTGWAAGEAEEAAGRMFRAWLAARGSTGAREDMQAVDQLRAFMGAHGVSRFERWDRDKRPNAEGEVVAEAAPVERVSVQHRAGWRRWIEEDDGRGYWRYYVTREAMGEALAGLDFRAAVKVLAEAGHITRDKDGKSTVLRRPPGVEKNMRLFEVRSTIMGAGVDDLDDEPGA
ncbi:DUF927 domain-containing protein [Acidocella sp.]|uniref:DUF927 domain-containing protein n=1 Tax=Acidocella sp. TaxID=50710 RepID=UPI00261B9818|nr:DUF927 domain-containing protein [Acidocella sp.]